MHCTQRSMFIHTHTHTHIYIYIYIYIYMYIRRGRRPRRIGLTQAPSTSSLQSQSLDEPVSCDHFPPTSAACALLFHILSPYWSPASRGGRRSVKINVSCEFERQHKQRDEETNGLTDPWINPRRMDRGFYKQTHGCGFSR